jgi:hypothetical protein
VADGGTAQIFQKANDEAISPPGPGFAHSSANRLCDGAIFFAVGAITVEGQSVEASANPLVSETLPAGAAAALRPYDLLEQAGFHRESEEYGHTLRTAGQLDLSGL